MHKDKDMLNPLWDDCFKTVFASRRNIGNLAGLLKAALTLDRDELDHLTLADPFLRRWFHRDKQGVLDVRVHTKSNCQS
jgi:hypothetical protein